MQKREEQEVGGEKEKGRGETGVRKKLDKECYAPCVSYIFVQVQILQNS